MSSFSPQSRILILGAGCAGLGAAWRLQELGHENFLVLEKNAWPGGLSASFADDRGFTWDIGGHVLFSHYEYFDRAVDAALAGQWIEHARESHIWIAGRFVPYPFQYNLRHLPKPQLSACLHGLLEVARGGRSEAANFRDWILNSFGRGIAESFLFPYNFKVWAHPLELMSRDWVGERVATVDLARVLDNIVFERDDTSWGPNSAFRFPRRGGTGAIWKAVAGCLDTGRIRYAADAVSVDLARKRVCTSDGEAYEYDALISTMPLDILARLTGRPSLIARAGKLLYTGTHVVGIGLKGSPPEQLAAKNWMYFPEPDSPFYRVTVFSNYSPANVPDAARYWSLMAEVSESPFKPVDRPRLVDDAIRGLKSTRLISNESEIASVWSYFAERAYPVPSADRDEHLAPAIAELESESVFSRGRFGGWRYEVGNQDHSFMQGVETASALLGATPISGGSKS
jgi:protoporphyrinogen oxidase